MNKLVPILPCSNADVLVEFYKNLGFELVGQFVRSYLVLRYDEMEFHFYGTKQVPPENNSSMCIIHTDDLETLYNTFTTGLKENTGKVPRIGFPKITKIRALSDDRRFTLTDPSGNTIYVITSKTSGIDTFFRQIDNEQHAKTFTILYDLVYSKEDFHVANNIVRKLLDVKEQFSDSDKAKLLLAVIDIHIGLGIPYDDTELKMLIVANQSNDEWKRIEEKFIDTCSLE